VIEVVVPCSCPGAPHEQDSVSLPSETDVRIGAAVMAAVRVSPSSIPEMESAISTALLHVAPRAWTFVDEKGEPLEVSAENIDARLTWNHGGMEVAEKANDLYGAGSPTGVFVPLLPKKPKASRSGRTAASTSPTPTSGSPTDSSDKPSLRAVTGGKRSGAKAS
jgi:hypothetical protein